MQLYDMFMLGILGITTFYGLRKGMAWQIASIASLVLSYFISLRFADALLPYLDVQPPLNRFVAMLIVYLGTSAGIWIVFRGVSKAIERVQLKEFDHQVGALFGVAKGILLCTVVTFFVVTMSNAGRDTVLQSRSGYYIAWFIHEATPVIPQEARQVLGPYLNTLNNRLDPTQPAQATNTANPVMRLNDPAFQNVVNSVIQEAGRQGLSTANPFTNNNQAPDTAPSVYSPQQPLPPTQPTPRPF